MYPTRDGSTPSQCIQGINAHARRLSFLFFIKFCPLLARYLSNFQLTQFFLSGSIMKFDKQQESRH